MHGGPFSHRFRPQLSPILHFHGPRPLYIPLTMHAHTQSKQGKQAHKHKQLGTRITSSSLQWRRAALLLAVSLLVVAVASATYCPPPPAPKPPTPTPGHGGRGSCPRDALKLHVCANVLGLVKAKIGAAPYEPCCSLLDGLVGLDAAVCLCTAIKANVLGIKLNLPIDLSLILNNCGKICPSDFQCRY